MDSLSDSGVVWDRLGPGIEDCLLLPVRVSVLDFDPGFIADLNLKKEIQLYDKILRERIQWP